MTNCRPHLLLASVLWLGIIHQTFAQYCANGIVGDTSPPDNTRPDYISTFATDDAFMLASLGAVECYGYIDRWQWYYSDRPGTCKDITFQVWRPVNVEKQDYVLVAENTLVAGVDWPCTVGGATITKTLWEGLPIPVIPGDVYGWRDGVGTIRSFVFSEAVLPGSGFYGTNMVLSSLDTCSYTTGDTCSWDSAFSGGQADLWSRSFALNARVNDLGFRPYFDNLAHDTPLYENAPAGTFIFKVIGDYDYNAQDIVQPTMYYRITNANPGADCNDKFEIDAYSGNVTTIAGVDFEGTTTCTLTIEAWFGNVQGNRQLTVNIIDVNEPHEINNLHDDLAIDAATTTAGTALFTIQETDPDGGGWPNQAYRMTNSLPYFDLFELGTPTNDDISSTLNLADYVSFPNYTLSLSSYDPYHLAGPKNLHIYIYNMRTPPVLINVPATVTVLETSAPIVTNVFNVDGLAQPDGRGNPLSYAITMVYPESALGLFGINGGNGQITHIANPGFDYFGQRQYEIEVQATDGDGLFVSDPYNVTVEIMWVNQPPVFATAAFTATIPENEPVGTEVPGIVLDATDRDTQIGDWFFYNIYQPGAYRFWPSNITHEVYVNDDIALAPGVISFTHNLIVQVQDQYGEIGTATLDITVTDVNDNAPVFSPDTYVGSVSEADFGDAYTGVTVTATDADAGNNAAIRYTIEGELPNLYFAVDAASGRVTLKQPIAYHEYPSMTFTVLAEDQGDPVLCDNATVTINVIEVNNNRPVFENHFYSIEIPSDTIVNSPILAVYATDNDTSAVNAVTYMFIVLQDEFTIGTSTGIISTAEELKHFRTFILYIYARDNGLPVLYSDPLHVRIDTYDPELNLVQIRLKMPLKDFLPQQEEFMDALRSTLSPWDVKLESAILDGDETLVSIYAIKNDVPDSTDYVGMKKEFVEKSEILSRLRSDFYGSPMSSIRGAAYAEYQPTLVEPKTKNWWLDTAAGIATLVILCLLALALLLTAFLLLAKYKGWLCFSKKTKKRPPAAPQGGPNDGFKLKYDLPKKTDEDEIAIAKNALYGGAAAGILAPVPMKSSAPPAKATYIPPDKNKLSSNPLVPIARLTGMRRSA